MHRRLILAGLAATGGLVTSAFLQVAVAAAIDPARRIELQFEECGSRMPTNVALRLRIWIIKNVLIGVGRALVGGQGKGLRIAEGHAKPERRMQLEIPHGRAARAVWVRVGRELWRIGRQNHSVNVIVSRSGLIGIKEQ